MKRTLFAMVSSPANCAITLVAILLIYTFRFMQTILIPSFFCAFIYFLKLKIYILSIADINYNYSDLQTYMYTTVIAHKHSFCILLCKLKYHILLLGK